jgi:hypothetical protein
VRGFCLEELKGGGNFLSWIEAKTRKLGGFYVGTTIGDTLGEAKISTSLS